MVLPKEFKGVTVLTKANIYFEGKVVSHSILLADGSKKTLGLIFPGKFHFNTHQAERMEIISGNCRIKLDSDKTSGWKDYLANQVFEVPAKSGFDIIVDREICEYICSYL